LPQGISKLDEHFCPRNTNHISKHFLTIRQQTPFIVGTKQVLFGGRIKALMGANKEYQLLKELLDFSPRL